MENNRLEKNFSISAVVSQWLEQLKNRSAITP